MINARISFFDLINLSTQLLVNQLALPDSSYQLSIARKVDRHRNWAHLAENNLPSTDQDRDCVHRAFHLPSSVSELIVLDNPEARPQASTNVEGVVLLRLLNGSTIWI